MNPLEEYPAIRRWVYRVFWIAGVAIGATQVVYLTIGQDQPVWLTAAVAVLAYLSIATNYQADRNTSVPGRHVAGGSS